MSYNADHLNNWIAEQLKHPMVKAMNPRFLYIHTDGNGLVNAENTAQFTDIIYMNACPH